MPEWKAYRILFKLIQTRRKCSKETLADALNKDAEARREAECRYCAKSLYNWTLDPTTKTPVVMREPKRKHLYEFLKKQLEDLGLTEKYSDCLSAITPAPEPAEYPEATFPPSLDGIPLVTEDPMREKTLFAYRDKPVPLIHSPELIAHLEDRHNCRAIDLAGRKFPVTVIWKNMATPQQSIPDPNQILGDFDLTPPTPLERSSQLTPADYANAREFMASELTKGPIKHEGMNYRMTHIRISGKKAKIHGAFGLYYDYILTQWALEWEMKKALSSGDRNVLKKLGKEGTLPMREAIEDKCNPFLDGRGRCAALSVSTLLVFPAEKDSYVCLLRRRSSQVAVAPGLLHVAPSGMFEAPNLLLPWSIQMNVWSELLEEVYDEKDLQTGPEHFPHHVLRRQPIPWLRENLDKGNVELSVTGICYDLLNLRPEICAVLFIKDPEFLAVRKMEYNWEYDAIGRIAVPLDRIDETIRAEDNGICAGAAMSLSLGREWIRRRHRI